MIVINPNDTEHTILVIPRYYPTDTVTVSLYNEVTQQDSMPANTYSITDGNMVVIFEFECMEGANYQLKITEAEEVVCRDKIFVTAQATQDFKLTNNVYYS